MDLHQSDTIAEWEGVAAAERNIFQWIAAKTHGILTLGNIITIVGFIVSLLGLIAITANHYLIGFTSLMLGRLLDIADGYAANATGTKSQLGESLDAGIDKVITVMTLVVLGATGVVNWFLLVGILLLHGAISLVGGMALWRKRRLHPSLVGKLSMASVWVALSGLVLAVALHHNRLLSGLCYSVGVISLVLAGWALELYRREYQSK